MFGFGLFDASQSHSVVSFVFSPNLWKHKLYRNKKQIPGCIRAANVGETLKSGLVGVWVGLSCMSWGPSS